MFLKKISFFIVLILLLCGVNNISAQAFNCLDCHDNVIQKSVHNEAIDCASCHQDITDESHAENKDKIKKVQCQSCHDDKSASMQSDIHRRLKGKVKNPPDCKKCHGTHEVQKPPVVNSLKAKMYCNKCHTNMVVANAYHGTLVSKNKCLSCHKKVDTKLTLPSSVHKNLQCADCHNYISNNLANHPKNVKSTQKADCYICHSEVAKEHTESIHGISLHDGIDEAAKCWDCHGSHNIQHVKNPTSLVYPKNLATTCGKCHDNPKLVEKFGFGIKNPGYMYEHSVHGKLVKEGKLDAANCSICHGTHDIKNRVQPNSKISAYNVPQTCGKCHQKIAEEFETSVHWIRAKKGVRESPVCNDCHSEHAIDQVSTKNKKEEIRLIQEKTCIVCHTNPKIAERYGAEAASVKQYQDSYHGLAAMRGDKEAALCVDCHAVHSILPKSHPASSINENNVTATCKKCHAEATEVFSKSYSHQTQDKQASYIESIVANVYFWMIVAIIGGMILHNLLIFFHELKKKRRHQQNEITIPRFTKNEVVQHLLLLVSFILLAITGFALKYSESWWADMLRTFGMNETVRQYTHRACAVIMILTGIYHVGYLFFTARGRDVLFNLLPRFSDITEARDNILYYLKLKKERPKFDKYDYAEKAEYWALIWGTIVMGVTGFVLWFPTIVGDWAPVWLIKVSELIHFYEAILASLAILVWHWFFVIFHPAEYPMSLTWMDGKMSLHTYRHHHERHFRKVVLEWKEYQAGKRDKKRVSNSTFLFTSALEKNGLNPDSIIQHEIDNDHELKAWLEQKMQPSVENTEKA